MSDNTKTYKIILVAAVSLWLLYKLFWTDESKENFDSGGSLADFKASRAVQPADYNNRRYDEMNDNVVDQLVAEQTVQDRPMDGGVGNFDRYDPYSETHATFDNYGKKRQINTKYMEEPYYSDKHDPRDFSYKGNKFTQRTPESVKELFDVAKMLPQESRQDWFDIEPLESTTKIQGTHLLNPKIHMGVNTVMSSKRNATHDIRGDIPNPKIRVSPFLNSTIEPDTNIKGLCAPI
jgi:hypothetical protein